jgi:glycosyltransferase involved in cell wall biosynthesis
MDLPALNPKSHNLEDKPATVSFVVVTRAKRPEVLANLLNSLAHFSDELVVILDNDDPEIHQRTASRADKVKVSTGKGSFEAYVEDIFENCTKDWIFRIDDDESLDPRWTREAIDHYISDRAATGYSIPRKWYVSREKYINVSPWFPDHQLRLFRNLPEMIKLPRFVHDPMEVTGETRRIDHLFIEHWVLLLEDRQGREEKAARYEANHPNNHYDKYYLYENYEYDLNGIPPASQENSQTDGDPLFLISEPDIPGIMRQRMKYSAAARIINHSSITLSPGSNYQENLNNDIFISYHWFKADRTACIWDGERSYLPDYLAPDQSLDVLIPVSLPSQPGEYFFQMDIVEEHTRWFSLEHNLLYSPLLKIRIV